jgi:hypothetical protein
MEQQPDRIDWQQAINNPVYTSDGKEIGFISSVQTDQIIFCVQLYIYPQMQNTHKEIIFLTMVFTKILILAHVTTS